MRYQVYPFVVLLSAFCASATEISVRGRVVDEDNVPVAGARVSLQENPQLLIADPTGAFTIHLPQAGVYHFAAEQVGFFPLKDRPVDLLEAEQEQEIVLVLNHVRNTSDSLHVTGALSPVDIEQTSSEQNLSGRQIQQVPYSSTHDLRNALALMPTVIRGRSGDLHFNGGAENQVLYTLDGFNISDPLTGTFNSRLSVDAVRSLTYTSGRYSPEFGKGSAGVLGIRTESGDDQFRYSATNFLPGFDSKHGVHLGSYVPRVSVSGPIIKGRAWFSDTVEADYSNVVVDGLPRGRDRTNRFGAANLLHGQVNLTPSNILFTDFLVNAANAPKAGLGALDPAPTTLDRRQREWFSSIKDQIYLTRGTLLEFGYAQNITFLRQIPQGDGLYVYTTDGRQGFNYINSTQKSQRKQALSNLFLPTFELAGTHQFKTGIDVDRINYSQDIRRTGYEDLDLEGRLVRRTIFSGSGSLKLSSTEAASYILDAWRPRRNLQMEAGLRQDWDDLVKRVSLSPRVAFSYSPRSWENTKISGGYAVVYDSTPLQLFARPLDQDSITTIYNPDRIVQFGPQVVSFAIRNRNLKAPHYQNWSAGLEQRLPWRLDLSLNFLRKRGINGFTYLADTPTAAFATYRLENYRRDVYDSAGITVHQSLLKGYEWMASYVRSRALSNAVVDITIDQPLLISDNIGRLGWDAPNRFLSWGYLPSPWTNWAFAYLFETRTGFPYSIQSDAGQLIGAPNSYRFPTYINLNFHVEHIVRLRTYRFAVRGGFNNITGHQNPTTVENVVGSPHFLNYYGSEGRHFVVRLRWLGKSS
jgi:hypothetical protein